MVAPTLRIDASAYVEDGCLPDFLHHGDNMVAKSKAFFGGSKPPPYSYCHCLCEIYAYEFLAARFCHKWKKAFA